METVVSPDNYTCSLGYWYSTLIYRRVLLCSSS